MSTGTPTIPMPCALYACVSTEQAERFGLGAQLTDLREYARRKGYLVRPEWELIDDRYLGGDRGRSQRIITAQQVFGRYALEAQAAAAVVRVN